MNESPVTTLNWGYPPHNRIAFQQVQQLFPTARIARGSAPITPSFSATEAAEKKPASPTLDLESFSYPGADGQQRTVSSMIDDTFTDAFLIAQNGVLLHEQYFGTMAPHSLHLLNSVTKSLVGMLAGIQNEKGKFNVDNLVSQHVPELADGAFKNTSVRHLLDMTAAVAFGENYADKQADFWHETEVVGWRPQLRTANTPDSLLDYAKTLTATEQLDGEKYHYRTVLTNVLGMVIERTAGEPLQKLLERELWRQLEPEQDLAIVVDKTGFPYVGAGGNACARDLMRFGQMMVNGGRVGTNQIVPEQWIEDTHRGTDEARRLLAESDYAAMLPGGHYRNKMWVGAREIGSMFAIGIHGQTIYMNDRTSVVMVKLSSHPESADMNLFGDTFTAMDALSEQLSSSKGTS